MCQSMSPAETQIANAKLQVAYLHSDLEDGRAVARRCAVCVCKSSRLFEGLWRPILVITF